MTPLQCCILLLLASSATSAAFEECRAPQQKPTRSDSNQEPTDVSDSLKSAVTSMKLVATDIRSNQLSAATIRKQAQVLVQLDRLIKLAESMPRQGQPAKKSGESSPKPGEPGRQPTASDGGRAKSGGTGSGGTGKAPGTDASPTPQSRQRILVQQVWGHLPAALQKRLLSAANEKAIPKYQRLVDKYFEAIAKKSTKRRVPVAEASATDAPGTTSDSNTRAKKTP